jgi:hypothetical protein
MSDDPYPDVPVDRLSNDGWNRVERTAETLFSLPTLRVEGYTLLYERSDLREAVRAAFGEADLPWRFFFATRLSFSPPLAPGVGAFSLFPTVLAAARREFAADLRERGFEAVTQGRSQRIHVETGDRARLTPYRARFDAGEVAAEVAAWLAVWIRAGEFRMAGGAYPTSGFGSVRLEQERYREELFELIRGVR